MSKYYVFWQTIYGFRLQIVSNISAGKQKKYRKFIRTNSCPLCPNPLSKIRKKIQKNKFWKTYILQNATNQLPFFKQKITNTTFFVYRWFSNSKLAVLCSRILHTRFSKKKYFWNCLENLDRTFRSKSLNWLENFDLKFARKFPFKLARKFWFQIGSKIFIQNWLKNFHWNWFENFDSNCLENFDSKLAQKFGFKLGNFHRPKMLNAHFSAGVKKWQFLKNLKSVYYKPSLNQVRTS